MLGGHPVTIHFRHPTDAGHTIVFLPIMTNQWFAFSHHPVVDEIVKAAALARAAGDDAAA